MRIFLETDRLVLEYLTVGDAGFILQLLNSPGWLEYIGDRNVKTIEAAETYILNGPIKSYKENGFGLSLVSLKNGGNPIGACGLLKRDYLEHPDLGFAFLPEFMGQGYGYESASAIMEFAKNELNVKTILAFTVPNNTASINLLKKLGFRFDRIFHMPGEDQELFLFTNQS